VFFAQLQLERIDRRFVGQMRDRIAGDDIVVFAIEHGDEARRGFRQPREVEAAGEKPVQAVPADDRAMAMPAQAADGPIGLAMALAFGLERG
jgi:hypothetical protein